MRHQRVQALRTEVGRSGRRRQMPCGGLSPRSPIYIGGVVFQIMFGLRRRGTPRGVYTIEEIARRVRPVAEKYGVDSVYVFGSYARGNARPDSDVDLLVSAKNVHGIRIGGLYLELRDSLGKEIDLITDESDPRFLAIIGKDAVKIYGRSGDPDSDVVHPGRRLRLIPSRAPRSARSGCSCRGRRRNR